jgi:hypothetical protein
VNVVATNPYGADTKTNGFTYNITTPPVRNSFNTVVFNPLLAAVDGTNAYTIGHAEYTVLSAGGFPRMRAYTSGPPAGATAPEPVPDGSGFYNVSGTLVIPGKNSAYAWRAFFINNSTPRWNASVNNSNGSFGNFSYPTVLLFDAWVRFIISSGGRIVSKFLCWSAGYSGQNRIELSPFYWQGASRSHPSGDLWNLNDFSTIGLPASVFPPYPPNIYNNGWFRLRVAYRPPQAQGDNTGVYRVWIESAGDATDPKVLDCSYAALNVTPPGGSYVYCVQSELDVLKPHTLDNMWYFGSNPLGSGNQNADLSDIVWYRT